MRKLHYNNEYIPNIYEFDDLHNLRFVLGNLKENPLICIGINPSTATDEFSDTTMNELIKFSKDNGYDSCIMVNPCPIRSSKPDELPFDKDIKQDILTENLKHIDDIFSKCSEKNALVMWGDFVNKRKYFTESVIEILSLCLKHNITAIHINSLSKSGNPYHFSYLIRRGLHAKEYTINNLDIKDYIKKLTNLL